MPEQTPTLRDMIKQAAERATYAELGERSIDPATSQRRISGAQLNRIARGDELRMPTEEKLRGIAAAIGRDYEYVRRAAIDLWLPPEEATSSPEEVTDERHERMLQRLEEARSTISEIEKEIGRMHDQRQRPKSA